LIWSLFPAAVREDAHFAWKQALSGREFRVGHLKCCPRTGHWRVRYWRFCPVAKRGVITGVEVATARAVWPAR
jgi:hypothetical protein